MWKRLFSTLLLVVFSAGFAQTTVRLAEVISSPERTEFLKSLLADFEAANPDIKVNLITVPWGQSFEKTLTMVQAGQEPDVIEMPEKWVSLYGQLDTLADLTPYLEASSASKNFTDLTWTGATLYNDTPYVVPYGFYVRALYYNKALFREAGIENPPATYAEFEEVARTISQTPGKYGYCLRGGSGGYGVTIDFMTSFMGSDAWFDENGKSTFDSPGAIEGFETQVNLFKNGYAPPDSVNWDYGGVTAGFYSGTCAMFMNDPDAYSILRDNIADPDDVGVAPQPLGPHGVSFPKVGFAGWSLFESSQNKDAAWRLIEFLTSPEVSLEWDKYLGGLVPIYDGVYETDPFYSDPARQAWATQLNDPRYHLELSYPFDLPEMGFLVDQLMVETTQEALLGMRTPAEVAHQWAEYLNEANAKR